MKYFTMEELDYIAKELLDNPCKETLKRLSDKYNGEESSTKELNWIEAPLNNNQVVIPEQNINLNTPLSNVQPINTGSVPTFNIPINQENNNQVVIPEKKDEQVVPKFDEELALKKPVWNPSVNTNNTLFNNSTNVQDNNSRIELQTNILNTPTVSDLNIQETPQNVTPSLQLPKIEDNLNLNNQVPFNGNLWESKNTGINNMMQTTDNFNVSLEQPVNNEIPVVQQPFFQPNLSLDNNPIPVSEPIPTGPTMFGQFEQNYNNNNAA